MTTDCFLQVTDAVHEKGCYIYIQLVALGRSAFPELLKEDDPSWPYVSASDVQLTGRSIPPRPLSLAGELLRCNIIPLLTDHITGDRNTGVHRIVCNCSIERGPPRGI